MDTEKIPYPPLSTPPRTLEEIIESESIRLSALIEQVSKLSETIKVIGDNLSRIRMDLDQLKSNLGES